MRVGRSSSIKITLNGVWINMIRLAIFADIHGKFLLPFKLVHYYQNLTAQKIDFIIQCGDMGAFPDKNNMDKATLKHAKYDRDELGFMDNFVHVNPQIAKFLDELNIPMYAVRGNHENHDFLDKLENQSTDLPYFVIDCYQKVRVLKTGHVFILDNGQDNISLVGIGRIGDKKGRDDKKFIQDYDRKQLQKLYKNCGDIDLLITHDKQRESIRGCGSDEIDEALNKIAFSYHFYGHTGEPFCEYLSENGITKSVKIKELEFNQKGKLENGCMIVLEKQNEHIQIKTVPLFDIIHFDKESWKNL